MRIAASPPSPPALVREARSVFAGCLAAVSMAAGALAFGGAIDPVAAVIGATLFAALVLVLDHNLVPYHHHDRFGAANRITLVRAAIFCLVAGRMMAPDPLAARVRSALAIAAVIATLLDGADGWAARRERLESAFGARFDMEVDAFSILVLSVLVARAAAAPAWVLAIGAMRYLFVAAGYLFPVLGRELPARPAVLWRRKTIAVGQSVTLVAALVPATPAAYAAAACAAALGLLSYSFAADVAILLMTGQRHGDGLPRRE